MTNPTPAAPWDDATPWQQDARYHENGLPANMAAILHDQYARAQRRNAGFIARNRGGFADHG